MKEDKKKIVVINSGSSSVKFQLIEFPEGKTLIKGLCDAIGHEHSEIVFECCGMKKKDDAKPKNHEEAIKEVLKILLNEGIINSLNELYGIGHRVVHGGEVFKEPSIINKRLIQKVEELNRLAPLHNPPNVLGMRILKEIAPEVKQVAVFDTGFHSSMLKQSYLYGLPMKLYEEHGIRRFGFHGTNHQYVSQKTAELMHQDIKELKIISCHLGNGASICAIKNGKSIDTSMGFTPLEGLVMGTRCGDIDPAIPLFLLDEGYSKEDVNRILNTESGLLGLSGISSDMRIVKENALKGNENALTARAVYAYRIKKYIGSYIASMNGADAIVFTGGIGEKEPLIREQILSELDNLGIKIDKNKNLKNSQEISADDSSVRIFIVEANEELMIAIETLRIIEEEKE